MTALDRDGRERQAVAMLTMPADARQMLAVRAEWPQIQVRKFGFNVITHQNLHAA